MLLLFVLLVLWASFTCMFYFLIDLSNWYLFLWVPAGLLVALAVFWSVTQITVGNNSTDVLSYYTE